MKAQTQVKVHWTKVARGSYEAPQMVVFTNCDIRGCKCDKWVAAVTDSEGYPYDRIECLPTMQDAKREAEKLLAEYLKDGQKACADCGEPGESIGHMGCQYPQDHN